MLFSFINEMFDFSININPGLFYIFKFIKEDSSLALGISFFIIFLL